MPTRLFSVRAALRLAAVAAWTAALVGVLLAGWLLACWSVKLRAGWRRRIVQSWGRGNATILGMRRLVTGRVPHGPSLLVANHLSYLDVVLLAAELPAVFVAKRDVRAWPGLGQVAWLVGTIFVDRDSRRDLIRTTAAMSKALSQGDSVVLFAEGTSTRGERVLPLKPALLEPAVQGGWPVRYATLGWRTPPDQPGADLALCWWGEMNFLPHLIGVARLTEFTGTVAFGADPVSANDRKTLAANLHSAIARHFIPVGDGVAPCHS